MDLEFSGYVQFGCVQRQQTIQPTEDQDRNDDGKITDQCAKLEHIRGKQWRGGEQHGENILVNIWKCKVGWLDNEHILCR